MSACSHDFSADFSDEAAQISRHGTYSLHPGEDMSLFNESRIEPRIDVSHGHSRSLNDAGRSLVCYESFSKILKGRATARHRVSKSNLLELGASRIIDRAAITVDGSAREEEHEWMHHNPLRPVLSIAPLEQLWWPVHLLSAVDFHWIGRMIRKQRCSAFVAATLQRDFGRKA